jgi:uncharacterized membrane protein YoaK (UPF0700 family)
VGRYPWMTTFLTGARETVAPRRGSRDGLLPPLLVALTAVTMAALTASPVPAGLRYALIVVLSVTMGAQNATARKLAVPDLTTTVLTLTITGMAADSPLAGATGTHLARRLISVVAMFLGALAGALLVLHVHIVYPLVIALVILAAVAIIAVASARNSRTTAM